jgi:hypothetical protein
VAVPRYLVFIDPIVRYLEPLNSRVSTALISEATAEVLDLSAADRALQLSSGGPVYRNRVGWALNWLKRAGLADARNGQWQLTPEGRELAAAHPILTRDILDGFAVRVEPRRLAPRGRTESPSPSPAPAAAGTRKAYRLQPRPLASGGQAEVYEATRKSDGKPFILKRLRNTFGENRMRREIEVQSSLTHPNIMPILDWDHSQHSWYVMPRGLRVMSELVRPVEPELICLIARSVAAALEFAHGAGHPHRDVKPQNIIELPDRSGITRWVLADWGLTRRAAGHTTAQWTKTGQLLGTEGFAPPEAYMDAHNVGVPGDIYALGQVVAWALGMVPIPNVSPTVGEPWRQLVEPMTIQAARERPQTMAEVQRLISLVCDSRSSKAPPTSS